MAEVSANATQPALTIAPADAAPRVDAPAAPAEPVPRLALLGGYVLVACGYAVTFSIPMPKSPWLEQGLILVALGAMLVGTALVLFAFVGNLFKRRR